MLTTVEFAVHQLAQAMESLLTIPHPQKLELLAELHAEILTEWDEDIADGAARAVETIMGEL
jgi:hypothetical protein